MIDVQHLEDQAKAANWKKREKKLIRDPKTGKFKKWMGGKTKRELAKKENTFHGIQTHIGKEFKRQHGRIAKPGEIVRTKTKSGRYHQGAYWYIRTEKGWRRSPTDTKKPGARIIKMVMEQSRTGRQ